MERGRHLSRYLYIGKMRISAMWLLPCPSSNREARGEKTCTQKRGMYVYSGDEDTHGHQRSSGGQRTHGRTPHSNVTTAPKSPKIHTLDYLIFLSFLRLHCLYLHARPRMYINKKQTRARCAMAPQLHDVSLLSLLPPRCLPCAFIQGGRSFDDPIIF